MTVDEDNQELEEREESEELTEEEAEFLSDDEVEVDPNVPVKPILDADEDVIALPSGQSVGMAEAVAFAVATRRRIIVLAGAPRSGKTSLLSDIFVSFQNGPFADFHFAGSETLVGFEEKCWLARAASLRETPETRRSSISEPRYLSLSLGVKEANEKVHMLLCDISGEVFDKAANSSEECRSIFDLAWADHFSIVLDGEKLGRVSEREFAYAQTKQFLLRLIDSGVLSKNTGVEIVFTKADLFNLGVDGNKTFNDVIVNELTVELKKRGFTATVFYTSAHFIYGTKEQPYELGALLDHWVNKGRQYQVTFAENLIRTSFREIDRFARFSDANTE